MGPRSQFPFKTTTLRWTLLCLLLPLCLLYAAFHQGQLEGDFSRPWFHQPMASQPLHQIDLLKASHNVTPPGASLLVYNRVPKCGSSTVGKLVKKLSHQLRYRYVGSRIYFERSLTEKQQRDIVEYLNNVTWRGRTDFAAFDRHVYYVNFSSYGAPPPVYVNVVRDPVERFVSNFYYLRSSRRLKMLRLSPSSKWANMTLEDCVLNNDSECNYFPGEKQEMMLSFFCGHHPFCRTVGSQDALQAAKGVVAARYSVVGVLEHLDLSLQLLEALVPRFFTGVLKLHYKSKRRPVTANKNREKPEVPQHILEELRRRFVAAGDVDLYYFIKQRLFMQKEKFLSNSNSSQPVFTDIMTASSGEQKNQTKNKIMANND